MRVADRPVGYLILTLGYSVEYGGRDGFIDDLYLAPDPRGRGLGKKLLDHGLAEAVKLGIRTLHLEVETDNGRAAPSLPLGRLLGDRQAPDAAAHCSVTFTAARACASEPRR